MSWAKNGAPVEWGPMKPVPQSLVAPFEAFIGKPVADMTDGEKLRAAREFLSASFGVTNGMTPHLPNPCEEVDVAPSVMPRCDCDGSCGKGRCRQRTRWTNKTAPTPSA